MNRAEILERALEAAGRSQAELSRRLHRSEPTVSRWFAEQNAPDYASALAIAKMTQLPPVDVLKAFEHDPTLLPVVQATEVPRDPRLVSLLQTVERGWHEADEPDRATAERVVPSLLPVRSANGQPPRRGTTKAGTRKYDKPQDPTFIPDNAREGANRPPLVHPLRGANVVVLHDREMAA